MACAKIPIKNDIHISGGGLVKIERHYGWGLTLAVGISMFLIVAISMFGIWLFISYAINKYPLPELPTPLSEELEIVIPVVAVGVVILVIYATRRILEANLRRTNFEGVRLPEANLQWVDLVGAKLQGADLQRADLAGANLQKADLRRANLLWANLEYANLQGANFQGADLRGANLRRANLWGVKFPGANLQRVNLQWADLQRADLKGANLRGADFRDTTIDPHTIDLSNTRNWREAHWDAEVYRLLLQRYGDKMVESR